MGAPRFVDEMDWSSSAARVAKAVNVYYVKDLARFSREELLAVPGADAAVVGEFAAALELLGLAFKASAPSARGARAGDGVTMPAGVPAFDWGCLYVRCAGRDDEGDEGHNADRVRRVVVAAYRKAGVARVIAATSDQLRAALGIPTDVVRRVDPANLQAEAGPLSFNEATVLGDDEVLVEASVPEWVAVMSRHWEWAPPGRHPLALELSHSLPVLSVTSVAGKYSEISRYERGVVVQMSLAGPALPERPEGVAPLDLAWFDGAPVGPDELAACLADPNAFVTYVGPETEIGFREVFERMPLDDVDPESYLVLRKKTGRSGR